MPSHDRSIFVPRTARVAAAAAVAVLLAGACGGGDSTSSDLTAAASAEPRTEPASQTEALAEAPNNQLPDVDVIDIASGAEVNLRTLAPADKPIVLWFWAPH